MFEGSPSEAGLTQAVSRRTFKILSERWHSESHVHQISFTEMLPKRHLQVELSLYTKGARANSQHVGLHLDFGCNLYENDMARQIATEHAWRLLPKEHLDAEDFNPFESGTYRSGHLSEDTGYYLGESIKCEDVSDSFETKGVITLQIWSRFTLTQTRRLQCTEGIKSAALRNILLYNSKVKDGMDVGDGDIVTLWAGEESVQVRKDLLLSASDALLGHFIHDTAQRQQNAVHIGETTIGALVALVKYLETAECPMAKISMEDLHHLGELSVRFLMPPLTKTIEWMYSRRLSIENAASILLNCETLDLDVDVREQVCEYIKKNVETICRTPGWQPLMERCGSVITEMLIELQQENDDMRRAL